MQRAWSDDDLVELVWLMRRRYGACTLRVLAEQAGQSRRHMHERTNGLIEQGRLTRSHVDGSLRTADERLVRG